MDSSNQDRPPYRFAPHVAACISSGCGVLLDLSRDRYVGIGSDEAQLLAQHILDWPSAARGIPGRASINGNSSKKQDVSNTDPNSSSGLADATEILQELITSGMVVKCTTPTNIPRKAALLEPSTGLSEEPDSETRIRAGDWYRFIRAVVRTSARLKLRTLAHIVRVLQSRHSATARGRHLWTYDNPAGIQDACVRIRTFRQLSPFLFEGRNACLYESLVLSDFLYSYGHAPKVVIGVKVTPFFSAHCWLQDGDIVFNDDPAYVGSFVPILVT